VASDTAPSSLAAELLTDDELGHIYCGRDDSIGLCGARLQGDAAPDDPLCVVCEDLEVSAPDACPKGGRCVC
jgi:hypothetical protein